MNRLSDTAIDIINDLHTERLDYNSEYLPLIDAAQRLAAYEDTGLEPEEIGEMKTAYDENQTPYMIEATGSEAVHIHNLLLAEAQGRLVVLPAKLRVRVWLTSWWKNSFEWAKLSAPIAKHIIYFSVEVGGVYAHFKDGSLNTKYFGEVAFLTREEAEKALEEEK